MDAQADKIGTESAVLLVHQLKTGIQPLDHADAQLELTGTETLALAVSEEEFGTLLQIHVYVQLEIGMDSHVFHVLLDRLGTQPA